MQSESDSNLNNLIEALNQGLLDLRRVAEQVVELSDKVPLLAPGMSIEQMAETAVLLKDARDAVSRAKTRCTFARDRLDEHFSRKIAFEGGEDGDGDVNYRTASHTFTAKAEGFFAPPPRTSPEFQKYIDWLSDVSVRSGVSKWDVLLTEGGLNRLCEKLLQEGQSLPRFLKQHTMARVAIRQRK